MIKRTLVSTFLTLMALSVFALAQSISVNPASQDVFLPNDAQFTIDISGISNLYGFQFDIAYDSSYLDNKSITETIVEGGFLSESQTATVFCVDPDLSTPGLIRNYGCTRQGEATSVSGSGVLASINLSSISPGTSSITIQNVKLSDINSVSLGAPTVNNGQVTTRFCTDGTFQDCRVGGEPQNETGVCQYGQEECIGGSWSGNCDSPPPVYPYPEICDGLDSDCDGVLDGSEGLTQNCGPQNETGICQFGTQSCTDGGGWTACTGAVDSTDELCPYTPADEDCDGDTGEYRGDVNCNCVVDIADMVAVAAEFGTTGVNGDINGDNIVDIFDLVTVGGSFGNVYC